MPASDAGVVSQRSDSGQTGVTSSGLTAVRTRRHQSVATRHHGRQRGVISAGHRSVSDRRAVCAGASVTDSKPAPVDDLCRRRAAPVPRYHEPGRADLDPPPPPPTTIIQCGERGARDISGTGLSGAIVVR